MNIQTSIPQTDPRANYVAHKKEIDEAITRVLEGGHYILGKEVAAFEHDFSVYIGGRYGVGVGSGTEALNIALRACGIGTGDAVLTVSHTAVATVAAIQLCGATPVLVEIDPETYSMDPPHLEETIAQLSEGQPSLGVGRLRAVIIVHLYGHPADMERILSVARRHGLLVIEDCAQSHGAACRGRTTGMWGDVAAFSFYPTKNLGAFGDGGMIVTDDPALAERAKFLREYGWRDRYISEFPGLNSRLDELQAAVLRVKLQYLEQENNQRRRLAHLYSEVLKETSLGLPLCRPDVSHVYHQYVVRSRHRDSLRAFLRERGIGTLIHYPVPVHLQPAYKGSIRFVGSLRHSEEAAAQVLSLPMYPELSPEQVQAVAQTIVAWDQNQPKNR